MRDILHHVPAVFSRPFHTFRRNSDHDPPSGQSGVTRYALCPTLRHGRETKITKYSNNDVNRVFRVWFTNDLVMEYVSTLNPPVHKETFHHESCRIPCPWKPREIYAPGRRLTSSGIVASLLEARAMVQRLRILTF